MNTFFFKRRIECPQTLELAKEHPFFKKYDGPTWQLNDTNQTVCFKIRAPSIFPSNVVQTVRKISSSYKMAKFPGCDFELEFFSSAVMIAPEALYCWMVNRLDLLTDLVP